MIKLSRGGAEFDAMLVAEGALKPKKLKKKKKDKIIEMRLVPRAAGFVCGRCGWSLRYERVEYNGEFFCRPECAKQKYNLKGRVTLKTVPKPDQEGEV